MSTLPNGFSHIEFDASFRVKGCYKGPAVPAGTEPAIVEDSLEALQGLRDFQDLDSLQGLRGDRFPPFSPRARAPRLPTDFMPKAGCGCRKR